MKGDFTLCERAELNQEGMKGARSKEKVRRRLILAGLVVAGFVLITMVPDGVHDRTSVRTGIRQVIIRSDSVMWRE
jgi:hypothetical protein